MEFAGQVAVVTGGSRGIGRAVATQLAARGARVVIGYLTQAAAANETLRGCGAAALAVQADVRTADGAAALVDAAVGAWGQLDILVNCVGAGGYSPLEQITLADWHAVLTTALDGVYHTCKAAVRPMMRRRTGRIVNVTGLRGIGGMPGQAEASAADGGVLGLTRALAREVAPWQITVNAVAVGLIMTDATAALPGEVRSWGERLVALGRLGTPAEAAAAALFFASPQASYITGQTLAVDGGWRMT